LCHDSVIGRCGIDGFIRSSAYSTLSAYSGLNAYTQRQSLDVFEIEGKLLERATRAGDFSNLGDQALDL
jgi:hypothetical protein